MKTEATFDYESNASTYSIRVQVKDDHNGTVEGVFTVTLTNDPSDDPQPNQSPTDLNSTSTLTMVENAALRTVVGEFNATDPEGGFLPITWSVDREMEVILFSYWIRMEL